MAGTIASIANLQAKNRALTNSVPLDVAIVDGSGNHVTSFGGTGGTSNADTSNFAVTSGLGTPMEGLFESSPSTVANGQVGVLGMTNDRKLKVSGSFSSTPITSATNTLTSVAENLASVSLLASNSGRLAFTLYNDSGGDVFVKCGATASATSFTKKLLPGESWGSAQLGINWTGAIDAIWATTPGTGGAAMRVNELAA